jgi:hypothetical protein
MSLEERERVILPAAIETQVNTSRLFPLLFI